MTTWNYRVIRKVGPGSSEITYQVHEVYYREDGSIDCWTQLPVEPLGVSESQLRNDIHAFLAAFRRPVLEERQLRGKPTLVEQKLPHGTDAHTDYQGRVERASGYITQLLGNHPLLKHDPALREAFDDVEQALLALRERVIESARKTPARTRTLVS